MKNLLCLSLICVFMFGASVSNAQIDKFKTGVSKVKDKTTKEEKPADKETQTKETEKSTTTSSTKTTVDFKELETQKMEWTSTFERLEKKWDIIPYSEYSSKKTEYNTFYAQFKTEYQKNNGKEHSDDYTQNMIKKVDAYYSETVSAEKMASMKEKSKRSFDENDWTVYPSDRIEDIEVVEKQIAEAKIFLTKTDPALVEFEQSLTAQKEKIRAYVDGGGLAKRDAEIEKKMVGERRLHAAGMSDASVNAVVTNNIDKERYGTALRVVITSKTWEIERNEYGVAILKFVRVDIATKKADGKCYFVKGSVAQKHLGGGNYGEKYLNIFYTEGEMNCDNVNK